MKRTARERESVKAEFTGWAATNVREMLWHPSQQVLKDDGQKVVATFELSSTVEFQRWVLGFGRHAKVLGPTALSSEIREKFQESADRYAPA